ncbi:putative membrane protein [Microcystis aeruginosa TAIHU98]|uniref:Putative membrane protein n=1 Tax=Microcystis aeruginosa TAIHU98 TaxID=1134457 RepID=L7EAR9_MICAE|nr:putative membrane protein [Microcystis aeruginosa TAIHU98]
MYGTGVFSPEFYLSFLFYSSRLGAIASLGVIYPSKNPMGFK